MHCVFRKIEHFRHILPELDCQKRLEAYVWRCFGYLPEGNAQSRGCGGAATFLLRPLL
jgi:hypothetical protein